MKYLKYVIIGTIAALCMVVIYIYKSTTTTQLPEVELSAPEIEIVGKLQTETYYMNRKAQEDLFRSAPFLDDPQAVKNLLAYVWKVDAIGEMSSVRIILSHMTCQPEQFIIEQLDAETNPWQKEKLIMLLTDFFSEDVLLALSRQLDDTRTVVVPENAYSSIEPPDIEDRVCDSAYGAIVLKLSILDFLESKEFRFPSHASFDVRDQYITKFKQYWEENKAYIFEELPKREVPERFRLR